MLKYYENINLGQIMAEDQWKDIPLYWSKNVFVPYSILSSIYVILQFCPTVIKLKIAEMKFDKIDCYNMVSYSC